MSGNPFEPAAVLGRAFRERVPSLDLARAAYVDGDIEVDEFEELVAASLEGRAVELSWAMRAREYERVERSVRFSSVARREWMVAKLEAGFEQLDG